MATAFQSGVSPYDILKKHLLDSQCRQQAHNLNTGKGVEQADVYTFSIYLNILYSYEL